MSKTKRNLIIVAAFLIPMLLTGLVWLPALAIYAIGGIMEGWPGAGIILFIGAFFAISLLPNLIIKMAGVKPYYNKISISLLSTLLNTVGIAIIISLLFFLDRLGQTG